MSELPTLVRIPFSHYCKKAEWGLTQVGLRYRTLDLLLGGMRYMERASPEGTVPMLVDGETPIYGSDLILRWAADRASPDTPPLYPAKWRSDVEAWELWADDEVGPVARREAYRVAHNQPFKLTRNPLVHGAAWAARGQTLGVLKFYKVRRFDESDSQAAPGIFRRIAQQLEESGTGFLFGPRPTAADIATAALVEPFTYAAPGRAYHEMEGWKETRDHLARVKPARTLRSGGRWMREKDWQWLEAMKPPAPLVSA